MNNVIFLRATPPTTTTVSAALVTQGCSYTLSSSLSSIYLALQPSSLPLQNN